MNRCESSIIRMLLYHLIRNNLMWIKHLSGVNRASGDSHFSVGTSGDVFE